ncbi:hypothetical protein NDU88_008435 [Pleurodeles waltl]|uniref:Uncharacterized protein n=1 Tax=Pleurodeles waltl TaxID=8319 RepID=A0AAV7PQD6_PLEWA|nr:hypothetical protein NDU88_008435 [Pleurodeles waltl]
MGPDEFRDKEDFRGCNLKRGRENDAEGEKNAKEKPGGERGKEPGKLSPDGIKASRCWQSAFWCSVNGARLHAGALQEPPVTQSLPDALDCPRRCPVSPCAMETHVDAQSRGGTTLACL